MDPHRDLDHIKNTQGLLLPPGSRVLGAARTCWLQLRRQRRFTNFLCDLKRSFGHSGAVAPSENLVPGALQRAALEA